MTTQKFINKLSQIKTLEQCETLFERAKEEKLSLTVLGLISQHYKLLKMRDAAFNEMYNEVHNV